MSRFRGALLVLGVLAQVAWAQLSPPLHKTWETNAYGALVSPLASLGITSIMPSYFPQTLKHGSSSSSRNSVATGLSRKQT